MVYSRDYLYKLRSEKSLSQRKLAGDAGISYQHYGLLENGNRGGKVSLVIMGKIAKVLGVSLDLIFEEEMKYINEVELEKEKKAKKNEKAL